MFPIERPSNSYQRAAGKHKKTLEQLQIIGDGMALCETKLTEERKICALILNIYNSIHLSVETGVTRVRA